MAYSGKTITFGADLLPNENNVYSLGSTTQAWKIYGNVTGNCSGTAGGVAWTNVSGHPTAVSSFTNDAGYLTSSSTLSAAKLSGTVPSTCLPTASTTTAGIIQIGTGSTNAMAGNTDVNNVTQNVLASTNEGSYPLLLSAYSTSSSSTSATTVNRIATIYAIPSTGALYANKVYNAVWNDYAEYRECDILPPGTCVQEQDDGHLIISDQRLIPGASIITDTFGFAEGETEKATTPIAIAGRVLAYTYLPREMYHAGMAVCSAPGGTIDIMTREEIRNYPDAIVGIVSEIPNYKTWGSGNIAVDDRIWIKVR